MARYRKKFKEIVKYLEVEENGKIIEQNITGPCFSRELKYIVRNSKTDLRIEFHLLFVFTGILWFQGYATGNFQFSSLDVFRILTDMLYFISHTDLKHNVSKPCQKFRVCRGKKLERIFLNSQFLTKESWFFCCQIKQSFKSVAKIRGNPKSLLPCPKIIL